MPTTNSSTPFEKISPAMTSDAMPLCLKSDEAVGEETRVVAAARSGGAECAG
jgi:hypothetical protein